MRVVWARVACVRARVRVRACGRVCARDHAHGARDHAHGARDLHVPEARMPSLSSGCRFRRLRAVTDGYNSCVTIMTVTDG